MINSNHHNDQKHGTNKCPNSTFFFGYPTPVGCENNATNIRIIMRLIIYLVMTPYLSCDTATETATIGIGSPAHSKTLYQTTSLSYAYPNQST